MDEDLMKIFLGQNRDIIQLIKIPEYIQPPLRFRLLYFFIMTILGHFVKDCCYHDWEICMSDLMNLDDSRDDVSNVVPSTSHHFTPITPPATSLSRD
ncbi:hypothetical protein RCL_jg17276.t1 [Rhizophagus clarus]|uniref:Uncharacterized protein n=1 Tax=Rhizophagus clarus TaxID=94130 RepID=A0A8H3KVD1_9GLOM|nr:hypothetical protein RCL_jg17276.t1 [Rhizophagus clarus]